LVGVTGRRTVASTHYRLNLVHVDGVRWHVSKDDAIRGYDAPGSNAYTFENSAAEANPDIILDSDGRSEDTGQLLGGTRVPRLDNPAIVMDSL
jgi:hypothetical protein